MTEKNIFDTFKNFIFRSLNDLKNVFIRLESSFNFFNVHHNLRLFIISDNIMFSRTANSFNRVFGSQIILYHKIFRSQFEHK